MLACVHSLVMKVEVVFFCLFVALLTADARKCPFHQASSGSEKTGCYIVVVNEATTREKFQEIVQRAVAMTDNGRLYGKVETIMMAFSVKLSLSSLEEVSRHAT